MNAMAYDILKSHSTIVQICIIQYLMGHVSIPASRESTHMFKSSTVDLYKDSFAGVRTSNFIHRSIREFRLSQQISISENKK
jgi:hypothetical protein